MNLTQDATYLSDAELETAIEALTAQHRIKDPHGLGTAPDVTALNLRLRAERDARRARTSPPVRP